jgi:hypothetical protein
MAAPTMSKMPAKEANAVIEQLTGVTLPPPTLDRKAHRQSGWAGKQRAQLGAQMRATVYEGQNLALPRQPLTLVIEMDAWSLRDRNHLGQSAQARAAGQPPARWPWVYGGMCFSLDQRVEGDRGRAHISSRGMVIARSSVDDVRDQLFTEAQRHGLAQAAKVPVVADGAVWIWNLAGDRFAQAGRRLDSDHANQYRCSVAHAVQPGDELERRAWIAPLLSKLKHGRATTLLKDLRALAKRLRKTKRQAIQSEIAYLRIHRGRMEYAAARQAGEPQGSGAMQSTCR